MICGEEVSQLVIRVPLFHMPEIHGIVYELIKVTNASPHKVRMAADVLAGYFRREMGYDFRQYAYNEDTDICDHVILISRSWGKERAIVGCVCFRFRDEATPQLNLSWVWIHPFLRNQGLLARFWPQFRRDYGLFGIEKPISPAMQKFLERHK